MRHFTLLAIGLCSFFFSRAALAESPASTEDGDPDRNAAARDEPEELKRFTITANPLGFAVLRFGANLEVLPATHHAIVVTPYFQTISVGLNAGAASGETSYKSLGAELGYHYYTGKRGANGFFIGPSLFYSQYSLTNTSTLNGTTTETSQSFGTYGVAMDLGGQHITKGGFTIGGGAGVMYVRTSASGLSTSTFVNFNTVVPRILLTAGYSF